MNSEKTFARDLTMNNRHKTWGDDCPATDIDFLMIEYDHGIAKGLVEYKVNSNRDVNFDSSTFLALKDLANRAGVPCFCVYYERESENWYRVVPLNAFARKFCQSGPIVL